MFVVLFQEIEILRENSSFLKSNYLASPPLVVMYALAGKIDINFLKDEISIVKEKEFF